MNCSARRRRSLTSFKQKYQGSKILEPEQEQKIEQLFLTTQKEETDLSAKSIDARKAIDWLGAINGLKAEINTLADEANQLQSEIDAFKPDREKLSRAVNAAALDGEYAGLTATRKQQEADKADLNTGEEALPGLESSVKDHAEVWKSFVKQTAKVKGELKEATPILQKVRSLDQKLSGIESSVSEADRAYSNDSEKIEAEKHKKLEVQKKHAEALESLDRVDVYINEHTQDELLVSDLAGIEEQFKGLILLQSEIGQKAARKEAVTKNLEIATKSLENYKKQSDIRRQELSESTKRLQESKDAYSLMLGERSLSEYRTQKEALLREEVLLKRIAELEDHRARLKDGKPCPLCGATEHPYAKGNVPVPDETEKKIAALTKLINEAESQEAVINQLKEAEILAKNILTDAEKLESVAVNEKMAAEKALTDANNGLVKLRADFAERRQAVAGRLQPFDITDIAETDISSPIESLRKRQKAWQDQVNKKGQIEKQVADITSELKRLDAVIETQSAALAEKQERLESLKKELATGREERSVLYGDMNPDDDERRLHKAISDAEAAETEARERHDALQQNWNAAKANIESLRKRIGKRAPELEKLEDAFVLALAPVGFSDEEQYLRARLPSEQKDELTANAKALDERQTELKARQKDREARLATELSRKITEKSLEELESQFKKYEEALKELRDTIADLKHQIRTNAEAKERIKDKQSAIEAQRKECQRWENLHALIGSADGKKYRNFAQGLTFDMLIGYANRQLQKMTSRYLLTRDSAQPLELNVVDNYQAGEIRSTKNLSGGESFIVSLSLALGLSRMASKKVRVDSLFLDEGFGTLDEEALDTALETLAGLQQDGKLIGVISHVPALKERISTQIQVAPQTGGRSELSGPGCVSIVPA